MGWKSNFTTNVTKAVNWMHTFPWQVSLFKQPKRINSTLIITEIYESHPHSNSINISNLPLWQLIGVPTFKNKIFPKRKLYKIKNLECHCCCKTRANY